jgi:hypothetical protein
MSTPHTQTRFALPPPPRRPSNGAQQPAATPRMRRAGKRGGNGFGEAGNDRACDAGLITDACLRRVGCTEVENPFTKGAQSSRERKETAPRAACCACWGKRSQSRRKWGMRHKRGAQQQEGSFFIFFQTALIEAQKQELIIDRRASWPSPFAQAGTARFTRRLSRLAPDCMLRQRGCQT